MSKTIVIVGYGPGISHAVAEKFAAGGFSVVIGARNVEQLNAGAKKLEAKGASVLAVPTDASSPDAVRALIQKARAFGELTAVHWNAAAPLAGDVVTAPIAELRAALDTGVTGLIAAVQEALPELKRAKDGAVLVTSGGFGLFDEGVDNAAVQFQAMGLAIANSAKHKAVRLLSKRLAKEDVFVGEVMVLGSVKGTPWDKGQATLEASTIAEKFWDLYRTSKNPLAQVK